MTKSDNRTILLHTKNPINLIILPYAKNYPWKIKSKICIPGDIKSRVISALFQLKLGHGYYKSYLQISGLSLNDECKCGKRDSLGPPLRYNL